MQSVVSTADSKPIIERKTQPAPRYRPVDPLPKSAKPRSWWPFRRQEPDIALRLLAVHMGQVTPRRR
jgi:hypothetical protein